MKFKPVLVLALAVPLAAGAIALNAPQNVRAQDTATVVTNTAQDAPLVPFDGGQEVAAARKIAVPASLRRSLPRGAKTVLCATTTVNGHALTLHLWNPTKGDSRLDVLANMATRSKSKSRVLTRLKRISLERIETGRITARVASLEKGMVIALEWSESQSAGAFMTVPMLAVVLPQGTSGKVILQDLSTESSASGNVFNSLRTDTRGETFVLLTTEVFDGGSQTVQRFVWNGTKFAAQGEGVTQPLSTKD